MDRPLRVDDVANPEFLDSFFHVLTSSTRRQALAELVANDGTVTVDELVALIAPQEVTAPLESISGELREEIELGVRHVHLPLLSDTGLVTWNRTGDTIELTPILDQLWSTVPELRGALELPSQSRDGGRSSRVDSTNESRRT